MSTVRLKQGVLFNFSPFDDSLFGKAHEMKCFVTEAHHHGGHHSHRKVDSLSAELSENTLDLDSEGTNMNPRGAILSLTMGKSWSSIPNRIGIPTL